MAEIYTTYFKLNGEASNSSFEFQENAVHLADILADSGVVEKVAVADMRRNTVYEPEVDNGE